MAEPNQATTIEVANAVIEKLEQQHESGHVSIGDFAKVIRSLIATTRDLERRIQTLEEEQREVREEKRRTQEPDIDEIKCKACRLNHKISPANMCGCEYCGLSPICRTCIIKNTLHDMCETCYDTFKARYNVQ